mmetsp:Transcript_32331/g.97443  ORF Transcript_32331/g.97443 Transcript_32331/m.97443 type:complete len:275 (-) Transcript_32331:26-850(-)
MPKKTKTKFEVTLKIDRLLNVPYVQGHFFTKVKLAKGDATVHKTERQQVSANTVIWDETKTFEVKMYTDSGGVLVPFFIKVSIRRESKGGKSAEKLGVVNIDLTNFVGFGSPVEKRYLLQAGTKKQGKDNSMVQLTVLLRQSEGAPVFRSHSRDARGTTDAADSMASPASPAAAAAPDIDPRASSNRVDLEELESSLLRIHEVSTASVNPDALPAVDPKIWMGTRETAVDVVDRLLEALGKPREISEDLVPKLWSQHDATSAMEEAFLQGDPKV